MPLPPNAPGDAAGNPANAQTPRQPRTDPPESQEQRWDRKLRESGYDDPAVREQIIKDLKLHPETADKKLKEILKKKGDDRKAIIEKYKGRADEAAKGYQRWGPLSGNLREIRPPKPEPRPSEFFRKRL